MEQPSLQSFEVIQVLAVGNEISSNGNVKGGLRSRPVELSPPCHGDDLESAKEVTVSMEVDAISED